ncbi:MAG: type II toxin-antitoxin system VapC family toxin [Candidatus Helarchaeota archaeon]
MGIFIDTGFFIGLAHPKDEFHQNCTRILEEMSSGKYGLIFTSSFVISEAATLLLIRTYGNLEILKEFHDLIYGQQQFAQIFSWTPEMERRTWDLFMTINKKAKEKKKLISFVDASNIVYCRTYDIPYIVSFDSHFDNFLTRIF